MENKKPWYTKTKNTPYVQLNISLYPEEKQSLLDAIKEHKLTQVGFIRQAYAMLEAGYFEAYNRLEGDYYEKRGSS